MSDVPHASTRLWKSIESFHPKVYVKHVSFGKGSPYEGQNVNLAPITLVAGVHGAGKSTFLSLVAESLHAGSTYYETPPIIRPQRNGGAFLGGECMLTIQRDGREVKVASDLGVSRDVWGRREDVEDGFYAILQGAYDVSSDIQIFFQNIDPTNLAKRRYGEPWVQKRSDLDALRGILGVSYDEVTYYPVDSDAGVLFPYVKARRGGQWVDSFQMSYGELTVHKLRWELAKAPEGSVMFLDEPEANIAPRGRAPFVDEIATLARASHRQVVIATHSEEFLRRAPLSVIRMCVRTGDSSSILTPSRVADLRDSLGVDHPLRYFLIVEDEAAASTLSLILTAHQFRHLSEAEIIMAGSWNDVLVTHASLLSSGRVSSVAVIDGDQRNKVSASKKSDSVLFCREMSRPKKYSSSLLRVIQETWRVD